MNKNIIQLGFNGALTESAIDKPIDITVPENTEFSAAILHSHGTVKMKIILNGSNAKCDIRAVYLTSGSHQNHLDIEIIHAHPHTYSTERVRGVLTDRGQQTFNGMIRIPRDSQKCEGAQNHKALLLSPTAIVRAVPELEIFADDVKCAHGSAMGALDEKQLFYLMSRGIPKSIATHMLIKAFLVDLLPETWESHINEWMHSHVHSLSEA